MLIAIVFYWCTIAINLFSRTGKCGRLEMHPTACLQGSSWPAWIKIFHTIYSCLTITGARAGVLAHGEITT